MARGLRIVSCPPGTGYGDAALQYAVGLARLGAAVRWSPVGWPATEELPRDGVLAHVPGALRDAAASVLERPVAYDTLLLDVPPPAVHARWARAHADHRLFAYVAWEADRLPADWPPALRPFERVFVPSEFNRALLADHGLPVEVVPHVAREVEREGHGERPRWGSVRPGDFVFYTIGTWTTRKALEETVRAYLGAFTAEDPVALVVKTAWIDHVARVALPPAERAAVDPRRVSTAWTLARILRGHAEPARVHLVPHPLPAREIDRLHAHGDCYVGLSRSEGFGLCAFDALLFGNPAVVTAWGGPADYLPADYPLTVRHELEPTTAAPDDEQHMRSPDTLWARPDGAHAGELMRRVFEDPEPWRRLARRAGDDLRERFAARSVCRRLAERMDLELG